MNAYIFQIILLLGVNIMLSLGLHIVTGETGLLSVGTAAFMAVGGYSAAIAHLRFGWSMYMGLIAGSLIAAVLGVLVGIPSLRLKGDYLLMGTFGFAEIVRVLLLNLEITNGALGIPGIPIMSTFCRIYAAAGLLLAITLYLSNSKTGRAWRAIREDETAAEAMGVDSTLYKTLAFVIGSSFCGLAGGLYAFLIGFISPNDFGVMSSFIVYLYLVLGGLGSVAGAILGTIVLTILPEWLRAAAAFRMIIYGLALVIMVIFRPQGILGGLELSRGLRPSQAATGSRRSG